MRALSLLKNLLPVGILLFGVGGCQTHRVMFSAVADLHQNRMGTSLLGGTPVDPNDYPASFYAQVDDGYCTSTLVAPNVALTAAHCVSASGGISLKLAGSKVTGHCEAASDGEEAGMDWSLCLLDHPIRGVPYENINTDRTIPKSGDAVKLTGFGCTRPDGSGGNDNVFREGTAKLTTADTTSGTVYQTSGKVALCRGDSGGAAFYGFDPGYTRRVIISVNSQFTQDPHTGETLFTSYLSSVADPHARAYFDDWIHKHNGIALCGITPAATGCRPE